LSIVNLFKVAISIAGNFFDINNVYIYHNKKKGQLFTPIYRDYPLSERGGIHLEKLIVWLVDGVARMLMEEMLNYMKKVGSIRYAPL